MDKATIRDLSGVAQTLLITLYIRAIESQRPDAMLKDEKAVELVSKRESDFQQIKKIKLDEHDKVIIILRNQQFDRYACEFIHRHPTAIVVHIGCGLDSRFERVDNGRVVWYDLDLPEVIKLRRKLFGEEKERYHYLAYSAFDKEWLDKLSTNKKHNFLFLAEGVFMYFKETQIKDFVHMLNNNFPGSELVFDAFSPLFVKLNNLRFKISRAKMVAHYQWVLNYGKDLETWCDGISLLDEWFPFNSSEPRLANYRWVRYIPHLAKAMGIYHYRIGSEYNVP